MVRVPKAALAGRTRRGILKAELKIDAGLLAEAEAAGVEPADVAEAAIRAAVLAKHAEASGEERARRWAEANAEAIAAHNARVREHGVFSDDLRTW